MRKVHVIDASQMQGLYLDLARLRTNYGVVTAYCIQYLDAMAEFFSRPDDVTPQSLASVLAATPRDAAKPSSP